MRTLRAKEQHIQESSVRIELMERRMEGTKKQTEMIGDLETELQKARKQERAYEEAMEQLQTDLDTLEQENKKLKVAATTVERQGTELRFLGTTSTSDKSSQLRQEHRQWRLKISRLRATSRRHIF